MKNIKLLFEKNSINAFDGHIKKYLHFDGKRKQWYYNLSVNKYFCGDHIYEILHVINYCMRKYGGAKFPIVIKCGRFEFYDKLVYVILECICYYMLVERRQKIVLLFDAHHTIWSEGIMFSPLRYLRSQNDFINHFSGDLDGRHYRKIVPQIADDKSDLSKLMQDISCFLVNNGVSENSSDDLAEVLTELVGNSREHAHTDTLIDIDLTNTTYSKEGDENVYYGMNTAILNFSNELFYAPLKYKMEKKLELTDKYKLVKTAYNYHKDFFNVEYEEKDFYSISSFQDKISGSIIKEMGGRGLTTLITALEEKADTHLCYMLSGNTILFLINEMLGSDDNHFVGFNKDSNYLTGIPDPEVIQKIPTFFPGTAYNLSFVIRKEWTL